MTIEASRDRVRAALDELETHWNALVPLWADAVGGGFEREYVRPLAARLKALSAATDDLAGAAEAARAAAGG